MNCSLTSPQFKLFAERILERPDLPLNPKFSTNKSRVANRQELVDLITETLQTAGRDHWIEKLTGLGYGLGLASVVRHLLTSCHAASHSVQLTIFIRRFRTHRWPLARWSQRLRCVCIITSSHIHLPLGPASASGQDQARLSGGDLQREEDARPTAAPLSVTTYYRGTYWLHLLRSPVDRASNRFSRIWDIMVNK